MTLIEADPKHAVDVSESSPSTPISDQSVTSPTLTVPSAPENLKQTAKEYDKDNKQFRRAIMDFIQSSQTDDSAALMMDLLSKYPTQDIFAVLQDSENKDATPVSLHREMKALMPAPAKRVFKEYKNKKKCATTPQQKDDYANSYTTQMFYAVVSDRLDTLRVLFKYGDPDKAPNRIPDIKAIYPGDQQMSVVHIAMVSDASLPLIKYLMEMKADLSVKDAQGRSPIHYAILLRRWLPLRYILETKQSDQSLWNMVDNFGHTPLSLLFALEPVNDREESFMKSVIQSLLNDIKVNTDLLAPVLDQFSDIALNRVLSKRTFFSLIDAKVTLKTDAYKKQIDSLTAEIMSLKTMIKEKEERDHAFDNVNRYEAIDEDDLRMMIGGHMPVLTTVGCTSKQITLSSLRSDRFGTTFSNDAGQAYVHLTLDFEQSVGVNNLVVSSGNYSRGGWGYKHLCGAVVYVSVDNVNWKLLHTIDVDDGNPINLMINQNLRAVKIERCSSMQLAQFYLT